MGVSAPRCVPIETGFHVCFAQGQRLELVEQTVDGGCGTGMTPFVSEQIVVSQLWTQPLT